MQGWISPTVSCFISVRHGGSHEMRIVRRSLNQAFPDFGWPIGLFLYLVIGALCEVSWACGEGGSVRIYSPLGPSPMLP